MSPNVGNFVHDLVEMAKAMETLPQVQAENERLQKALDNALRTVQDREISIIGYKDEVEVLLSRVRSLEVERDDASFRVLEAEDKAHNALSCMRDAKTCLELAIADLDPPKPEPVKEPESQPVTTPAQDGQSAKDPTVDETHLSTAETAHGHVGNSENVGSTSLASNSSEHQGQSEGSPTSTAPSTGANADTSLVSSTTPVEQTSLIEPTHGPYYGKRYIDVNGYVSRYDWEQGGGTEEDYDWRPENRIADRSY